MNGEKPREQEPEKNRKKEFILKSPPESAEELKRKALEANARLAIRQMEQKETGERMKLQQDLEKAFGGIESKESNIDRLTEEFKAEFKKGNIIYRLETKIPIGASYREYSENSSVSTYEIYDVKKEDSRLNLRKSIETPSNWGKFGNVLVQIEPAVEYKSIYENHTREEKIWFGMRTKTIEERVIVGKEAAPKTFADYGISDAKNERVYHLYVEYLMDNTGMNENRTPHCHIDFAMAEHLARELFSNFSNNANGLWNFLQSIESDLLRLSRPIHKSLLLGGPEGKMVFYEFTSENLAQAQKMSGIISPSQAKGDIKKEPDKIISW